MHWLSLLIHGCFFKFWLCIINCCSQIWHRFYILYTLDRFIFIWIFKGLKALICLLIHHSIKATKTNFSLCSVSRCLMWKIFFRIHYRWIKSDIIICSKIWSRSPNGLWLISTMRNAIIISSRLVKSCMINPYSKLIMFTYNYLALYLIFYDERNLYLLMLTILKW